MKLNKVITESAHAKLKTIFEEAKNYFNERVKSIDPKDAKRKEIIRQFVDEVYELIEERIVEKFTDEEFKSFVYNEIYGAFGDFMAPPDPMRELERMLTGK